MPLQFPWLTDIHLNFLDDALLDQFVERLSKKRADGFLIAGDIGEADSITRYLSILSDRIRRPIYFVLGNHDYYRASIEHVRSEIVKLVSRKPSLHWLSNEKIISLTSNTALIGHDSWADAQLGDFWKSDIRLNDFVLIGDFLGLTKKECLERLTSLGEEAANHFRELLPVAFEHHKNVIIVTHVPPFAESARHRGKICEPNWLPFFSCKAVGDVLLSTMAKHRDKDALVICGHTHGSAEFQPLPNLQVITGGAVYGKPSIHRALIID